MNLAAKYNRTELIRDGEIQAWKGVERSTGEAVVLYLYTGEISGGQPLSEFARGSLAQSLGTGETQVEGGVFGLSPCMVARVARVGMPAAMPAKTPDPPVFSAPPVGAAAPRFQDAGAPQAESAQTPVPAISTSGGPGDFTAMFGAAVAGIGDASSAADTPAAEVPKPAPILAAPAPLASAPDVPAGDAAKPAAPSVEPMGEFTSLFRAADAAPAPKPAAEVKPLVEAPVTPPEPQKPAAPPQPGVFTSLYMAANPEVAAKPADVPAEAPPAEPQTPIEPVVSTPTGPAAPPQPGVFTSLYMAANPESTTEGATPEVSPSPEVPLAAPAAESVVEKAAMGEFTSLFMAAKPEAAPAKPATPAQAASTSATESTPAAFALPEAQAQPMSEQQEDPGEFTMAFRSADQPAPASKVIHEAAPEAASQPSLEAAPPVSSFDETAELDVGSALPFLPPADEPVIPATPLRPSAEKDIGAESAPGDFTRLFVATPEHGSPGEPVGTSSKSPIVAPDLPVAEPEAALPTSGVASLSDAASAVPESAVEEVERFSSASPAKGPIRFVASDKPTAEDASKPPRSPLQSGSFSQTYVSTNEMPAMHEPIPGVPVPEAPETQMPPASRMSVASGDAMPGEFTMLFASPGGAKAEPTPAPVVTPAPAAQPAPPSQPAPPAEEAPASVAKPAPGEGPGEFTRFFQAGEVDQLKQELAAMSPAAPAASPAKPVQEEPVGEFTRMFSAAEIASKTEKPKDPGVFTNLYLAADQKSAPMDAPATPAASAGPPMFTTPAPAPEDAGGSFTAMFRAAEGGVTPSTPAPATPAPASADVFMPPTTGGGFGSAPMSSGSDEPSFTRYFQAGDLSASPVAPQHQDVAAPSPDLPAYSSGYSKGATSFFQAVPQAAAPAAPVEQGPGEYTRMISGDEVRQAMAGPGGQPGAAAPGAAAPGAAGGGGGMPMPIGVPMSAPSVSGPYVQGPRMTGPQMSGPQISSSGISAPHLQGPQMSGPQMSGPQVQGPQMATPQLQTPHLQVPPMQAPGGTPVAPGQQAPAGGSRASKIIIIATVLVTVIAVVLVLLVAYFILKG